jgi:arginase
VKTSVIVVPYDCARRGERMGAGPEHLISVGLVDTLQSDGHDVAVDTVEAAAGWHPETRATFDLIAGVERASRAAHAMGRFPVILSGNCLMSVGAIAASADVRSLVWLDAHADFNTPETTQSGFLDGMALAIATGRCWQGLVREVNGFTSIADERVILAGARDLDSPERQALAASTITRLESAAIESRLASETVRVATDTGAHVHLDLDVLDISEGRANQFATGGGITGRQLLTALAAVARTGRVRSLTVAAYDPRYDADGRIARIAVRAIVDTLRGASS